MSDDVPSSTPKIDIKSGTTIPGYGESLTVNIVTGAPSIAIPLSLTAVRGEAPQLGLQYGGTVENGPFGIGFSLEFSSIARRTDKGIPRYDASDVMLLDGQQLTPRYVREGSGWKRDERIEAGFRVQSYRPRVESEFSVIEWWTSLDDAASFWKVVDGNNVTSIYGRNAAARVADRHDPARIFEWMLETRQDSRGNLVEARYKAEDADGVPPVFLDGVGPKKYLQSIRYGNYRLGETTGFTVELLFDYGEYDLEKPSLEPVRPWPARRDPFISYRAGFPVTTARLCRNILTIHHFPDEPETGVALTGVTSLTYEQGPVCAMLTASQRHGYRKLKDGSYWRESMPPMRFEYGPDRLSASAARPLTVSGREQFPVAAAGAHVQMVDLFGDGIPGILYNDDSSVVYWPAEGEGRYGAAARQSEFPNFRELGGQSNLLADISGNGHKDLMVRDVGMAGFFGNGNDGNWAPFQPFSSAPVELADPDAELTDLSGTGRQDLWIAAGEERLRVYGSRGRAGYGAPVEQAVTTDFPVGTSGEAILVTFADIFGDGLNHRVQVTERGISVWPALGYGRFAEPKRLENPPALGLPAKANRVFFADVGGSGFDDLILMDGFCVQVCRNLSGRGFADPLRLDLPVAVDDGDQVYFADVCGVGRQALVVVKVGAEAQGYYMPMAEGAPFHIVAFENGFGRRCEIDYRSSTDFYLADRRQGRPWRGKIPFPLLLVERLTSFDGPSGRAVTQCYQYGDGYYDPHEREFAGFGYVKSQDTQIFSPGAWHFAPGKPSDPPPADGAPVQPLIAETWTGTGQPFAPDAGSCPVPAAGGDRIVPPDALAGEIWQAGGSAVREAFRALRGRQIATRETGVSASGEAEPVPFAVQGQNYEVAMIQPPLDGNAGVFLVSARESRAWRFDGAPDDPRIQQTAALEIDAFGNVTRSVSVVYPRRPVGGAVPGQEKGAVSADIGDFANHPPTVLEPYNRIGVRWRQQAFEIHGIALSASRLLTFDDLKTQVVAALQPDRQRPYGSPFTGSDPQSRLLTCQRTRFWDEAGQAAAPYGVVGPQALEYAGQNAVFPDAFVKGLFGARIDDALLEPSGGAGAGYLLDDGYWWQSGDVTHYGKADVYFVALKTVDPFGAAAQFTYDKYLIAIESVEDALGFTTLSRTDYQTLQPWRVVDPNGITVEALYTPLGRITAVSRYGSIDGVPAGDASLANYVPVPQPSLDDIIADPEKYLQGAGSYYFEDLSAWRDRASPVHSVLLEANQYAERQAGGPIEERPVAIGLVFVDGSMSVIARQERVERSAVETQFLPGDAAGAAGGDWCWVTLDQVVRDEKEQVVTRYTPYFVLEPGYRLDPPVPAFRNSYDALGRAVRVDTPKGFFTKTVYSAWSTVFYDEDDTVIQSTYYKEHINDTDPNFADERDALIKSAALADTPATSFLDPQGQTIVERRILLEPDGKGATVAVAMDTGSWLDIQGRVIRQADPRFYNGGRPERFNQEFVLDMLGRPLMATSTDRGKTEAGTRFILTDTTGQKLCEWDNAGTMARQQFDLLRRVISQRVTTPSETFVALVTQYGTSPDINSIGQVVGVWNQANVITAQLFDLLGNTLSQTRQFVAGNDGTAIDWNDPVRIEMLPAVWTLSNLYNRRGWPVAETNADGSRQTTEYFSNGWRRQLTLDDGGGTPAAVATNLRYNPRADAVSIQTANGVVTSKIYDDRTFRLAQTKSIRQTDGAVLADESYFYDAVGNVTRVRDNASTTEFFANAVAEPLNDYTYDSLYRLIAATGRQQVGMALSQQQRQGRQVDPERLVPYRRRFTYDASNNLLEIQHSASQPGDSWTRRLAVSSTSNHAVPQKMISGGHTPDDFFDLNGNLTELNYLQPMTFDYAGRLSASDVIDRPQGQNDRICYAYDQGGMRQRKTDYRLSAGNDNTVASDTFYIGNLAVVAADGGRGEALRVHLGQECVLSVERVYPQGKDPEPPRRRFPLANYQRSVTREADDAGNVVRLEHYFPYGGTACSKETGASGPVRYGFVGKELDQATGFYMMGQRYYCPYLSRWLTPDPAGAVDGLNLYAYVNDNPTSLVDPTGTNGAEVRGTTEQLNAHQARIEADHDRAVRFVGDTITALENYLDPGTRATVSAKVAPNLKEYFGIQGTTETDLGDIREILGNYRKVSAYLNQEKPETRWQRFRAWFVDVPLYRIRPDGGNTLAYVQGATPSWPDWGVVPRSLRSRPLSSGWTGWGLAALGVGLAVGGGLALGTAVTVGAVAAYAGGALLTAGVAVSASGNAVRRLTPSSGINLHENLFKKSGRTRSATIVHEATHLVFGTEDHAYKWQDKFATLSTTQHMTNADSYGLFAERVTRG